MINLFENFRSVVNDRKVKSNLDIDVNSNSTELLSSNVTTPAPSSVVTPLNLDVFLNGSLTPVQSKQINQEKTKPPETVPGPSQTKPEKTKPQETEKTKHQETQPEKTKTPETKLQETKSEKTDPQETKPQKTNTIETKSSAPTKKVVELSVPLMEAKDAPPQTESSSKSCSMPVTLKTDVNEIDLDEIDGIFVDIGNNGNQDADIIKVNNADEDNDIDDKDGQSESKFSTESLPSSQSSSRESFFTKENPDENRFDAVSPIVCSTCNTCDHPDASVHCHGCRRAYCSFCSVTPSPAGLPWSCFLCQMEATRRPKTDSSVRVLSLRSRGRKSSPEPLAAKRRRSNHVVDAKPSLSFSSSSSSSSLSSSTADSRDTSLDNSSLEMDGNQTPSTAPSTSSTLPQSTTRKLECSATITGGKTIEVKFRPCRTTMIYGKGGASGGKISPLESVIDEGMMEVEDPVIVDPDSLLDNSTMEAEEEDDDEDDDDDEEENAENCLLPREGDSTQSLTDKLNLAVEEIRRLKVGNCDIT